MTVANDRVFPLPCLARDQSVLRAGRAGFDLLANRREQAGGMVGGGAGGGGLRGFVVLYSVHLFLRHSSGSSIYATNSPFL